MFRLFSLAIAGLLLVPALPARADDAQALLAKHKAFVGWQYGDGAFTSLVLDRSLTDDKGAIVQRATDRRAGLVYRHDYTGEKATDARSTGFTGNVFWETNRNGFTVPVVGDDAKYYLAADVLFMEGTTELPSELRTPATVSGRTLPVVRVTMHGAEPIDLLRRS
ncbi:MAG TPA: hypothetical protein VGN11_02310 [Candidatus Baltobacteraceae bacterium]|nr:hypothetical protein [Candidatus Baltobacteraceae bacterium]